MKKFDFPRKAIQELQSFNARHFPQERYHTALTLGLSAIEELYFCAKNAIDTSMHMSERVLYANDYSKRRIAEYQGQKRLCVFVPGYMQTAVGFYRLESLVNIETFDAFTYVWQDFPYSQDIFISADALAQKLRELNESLHPEEIYLIGHSQGGIIIRTALQYGLTLGLPIRKCLFLCSPHQGTWVGLGGLTHGPIRTCIGHLPYISEVHGESAFQLLPGSKFLTELNDRPLPTGVECFAIRYAFDPMVIPAKNARMPYREAHNFYIEKIGHAQPLYCARASRIALRCLFGDWAKVPRAHGIQD